MKAQWRNLIMANYAVDPIVLQPYLPKDTELLFYNDKCYISLVGFMFLHTRLLGGVPIPFHESFEEINLRFYLKHNNQDSGWRKGTSFIKEIVPKPLIAKAANLLYKEHYCSMPCRHSWQDDGNIKEVSYEWKSGDKWNHMKVKAKNEPHELIVGSEEEFITEQPWGYTRMSPTVTSEYEVKHPRWRTYPLMNYDIHINADKLFANPLAEALKKQPDSVFLVEGSEVEMMSWRTIAK